MLKCVFVLATAVCFLLFVPWLRPYQGSAVVGQRDPQAGGGALPAEERADHGPRLPLRYLPGGSAGEPGHLERYWLHLINTRRGLRKQWKENV